MTLIIMSIVYENLSLKELDNSIKLTLDDLMHRGFTITMADVEVENQQHTHLPNTNFLSLKDIPGPVIKGVLKPGGEHHG
ncbi:MAG: hypothetical protein J6R32_02470 [Bacteroidales bacterium]|nr:hypothetical protein [Bacteroidales bacterium]